MTAGEIVAVFDGLTLTPDPPPTAEQQAWGVWPTHSGELVLFGVTVRVHRLNTGERVFDADDCGRLFAAMGLTEGDRP